MGMRMNNIQMSTKVKRIDLIATLKKNLANHSRIVAEARDGYLAKARKALEERLEDLRKGKTISLAFQLSPPQDYSKVYKSVLAMLEWNTDEIVKLEADEFRQLVEDKWDWTHGFYATNSSYSSTAASHKEDSDDDD